MSRAIPDLHGRGAKRVQSLIGLRMKPTTCFMMHCVGSRHCLLESKTIGQVAAP